MELSKSQQLKAANETAKIRQRLNEAVEKYLEEYTQESFGEALGKSGTWISQCMNPLHPTEFQVVQVPYLRRTLGDGFLHQIAEDLGCFLVPRPNVDVSKLDLKELSHVVRDFARYMEGISEATADGRITRDEAGEAWRRGSDLIVQVLMVSRALNEAVE